jgi:predicted ATPase
LNNLEKEMAVIRTPDQRLRVFVSSTLQELADERAAARDAIARLRLAPVMFELGARPHPPRDLYRAYLDQSHIFLAIYWQRYGWVAPGMDISGLEDEYRLSGGRPKLIYIKSPSPDREPRLKEMLDHIRDHDGVSYKPFTTASELRDLIENDLAIMLTERFEASLPAPTESAPSRRDNLPAALTRIIGRDRETAAARDLLRRDDVGLLTFTGPGGTGKTRLSLHVASGLIDDFADGVYQTRLASLTDPDQVIPAIAQTLDVRDASGRAPIDGLKEHLRNKRMLLLLDNFEQVVAAAPQVSDLLSSCPRVKIIATSRTPLRVRGEKEMPVEPLALPPAHLPPASGGEQGGAWLSQFAAVELFVQRASDVKPDFALTADNAPAVAEICHRLDGLPLAIELAAARIRALTPQAMLARFDRRLDLLKGGARDLPDRQQTLRHAIDWSYNLLDQNAKTLLRRLPVFVGSWTFEATEAVCEESDLSADVLDVLESLVDSSLLKRVESGGEVRFAMLETIREYARERLIESGEQDAIHRRHADYFARLAEEAEPYLIGAQRAAWLDRLETDLDDIRAAIEWSKSEKGDAAIGLRLSSALLWFWYMRGYMSDGRAAMDAALARADSDLPAALRAKTLLASGVLAWTLGDFIAARARLEDSVSLLREIDNPRRLAFALTFLGLVEMSQGDPQRARDRCAESVDLSRAAGNKWGEAFALNWLGESEFALGDAASARSHYEASLALFRAIGDAWGTAMPLHAMAGMAWNESHYEAARSLYQESGALLREAGDRWGYARSMTGSAAAALHQGNAMQAKILFEVTLSLWRQIGNKAGMGRCLAGLAGAAAADGQPKRAARLLGAANGLFQVASLGADDTSASIIFDAADRSEFSRCLSAARAGLDDAAFVAEWRAGHAMTFDQALNFALGET